MMNLFWYPIWILPSDCKLTTPKPLSESKKIRTKSVSLFLFLHVYFSRQKGRHQIQRRRLWCTSNFYKSLDLSGRCFWINVLVNVISLRTVNYSTILIICGYSVRKTDLIQPRSNIQTDFENTDTPSKVSLFQTQSFKR